MIATYALRRILQKFVGRTAAQKVEVQVRNNRDSAVNHMYDRASEFRSPTTALLAGIAHDPVAREAFEQGLDQKFRSARIPQRIRANPIPEVIIGGGIHAAIYCAARVACGHPKPLVLEGRARVGGAFAMSIKPSFYLNSRNRPGKLNLPGTTGALNVLPGSEIQPSDLSGDEYQINSDLAFAIRTTLAANATVLSGVKVEGWETLSAARYSAASPFSYDYEVTVRNRQGALLRIRCMRLLIATGLGEPKTLPNQEKNDRVMHYEEFMGRLDSPFPLRDMDRVAVIGAGDSGRTVIEALNGQGPQRGGSVAALDWPSQIDWYGVGDPNGDDDSCLFRSGWESSNRSRYKGIARLLPRDYEGPVAREVRVRALIDRANSIGRGFDCAFVNGKPYDYVVTCLGWEDRSAAFASQYTFAPAERDGIIVATCPSGYNVWKIGPVAQLPMTAVERDASPAARQVPENATSIYRYAVKTAALARSLEPTPIITGR